MPANFPTTEGATVIVANRDKRYAARINAKTTSRNNSPQLFILF